MLRNLLSFYPFDTFGSVDLHRFLQLLYPLFAFPEPKKSSDSAIGFLNILPSR